MINAQQWIHLDEDVNQYLEHLLVVPTNDAARSRQFNLTLWSPNDVTL